MISRLISSRQEGPKVRIVFQHELDDGTVVGGPYIEDRQPEEAEDNFETFMAGHRAPLEYERANPVIEKTPVEALRKALFQFDDATIKEALAVDDRKLAEIKEASAVAAEATP